MHCIQCFTSFKTDSFGIYGHHNSMERRSRLRNGSGDGADDRLPHLVGDRGPGATMDVFPSVRTLPRQVSSQTIVEQYIYITFKHI